MWVCSLTQSISNRFCLVSNIVIKEQNGFLFFYTCHLPEVSPLL